MPPTRKRKYDGTAPYAKKVRRSGPPPVRSVKPYYPTSETKYFCCSGNGGVTWAGTDWSGSEVVCSNYITSAAAVGAYTDSCLLPTAQGSGFGEVDGNKYKLKKLRVKGFVTLPSIVSGDTTALTAGRVRVVLVMDTQPRGTQAQGEDIMEDIGGTFNNLYSFQRVGDNLGRFRILKDEMVDITPVLVSAFAGTGAYAVFDGQSFKFSWKPKTPLPITIKSGGTTPAVGKTQSHNIFMLVVGGHSSAASQVNISFTSRAYYCE